MKTIPSKSSESLPVLHGRFGKEKVCKNEQHIVELQESPLASFAQHFWRNAVKVRDCLNFLRRLEQTYSLQHDVFSETIIMYLAAMCADDDADNYTVQNFLKRQKKKELIKPISEILSRVVCRDCDGRELTVRDCIRTLRNKYICHFDNFEDYDIYGNEGIGEGKWTLDDRDMMFRLLFNDGGHINDLVVAVCNAVGRADQMGLQELCDGATKAPEGLRTAATGST